MKKHLLIHGACCLSFLLPALAVAQSAATATVPTANQLHSAPNAAVSATFSQALGVGAAAALKVHSMQRGGMRAGHTGVVSTNGNTLTFAPTYGFSAGEVISVTAIAGVKNTAGQAIIPPYSWQFVVAATGPGRGYFSTGSDPVLFTGSKTIVAGDVDNDGDMDMLSANIGDQTVNVCLNNGQGVFSLAPSNPSPSVRNNPYGLALGDLDNDGDLDFVTANVNDRSVSVRLNDGTGNFTPHPLHPEVAVAYGPTDIALGDLDGDGDLDFVTSSQAVYGRLSVRLNNGTGTFVAAADVQVGSSPQGVTLGDIDGDGDLDIAAANVSSNSVSIRVNNGSASFADPTVGAELPVGMFPELVVLRDADGDGDVDLFTANNHDGTVSLRLNNGQGLFTAPATGAEITVGGYPKGLALGDVDSDGDIDLVVNTNTIALYFNDGQGLFSSAPYNAIPISNGCGGNIALSDLDGDGDLDFLGPNAGGGAFIRLNGSSRVLATAPANQPESALVVSPNPARSVLRVAGLAAQCPVCLFDVAGRLVYTLPYPGDHALLTLPDGLPRGFYILRSGPQSRRLLLE
ncbi:FG-GAP-like repeat-containing protein [Hymenobacter sp. DH14]|uniref:FG-GAP-like repeat-containing protein n=1 Tax=Hymenobacter cyanobacteriorum TaxID=2926463 RepID=A0A9X1VGA1_9BACT|nr:FG-GAP-like repeat-containing protein [Hymenobacter cyanobacteriorum]MCI1188386.1 FG-GAP-like repeat-containing protein [Hymenobacter cyanobacteriorum]